MMLLRRIAYNMLALFRSVTLRSKEHRDMSIERIDSLLHGMISDRPTMAHGVEPKHSAA